MRLSFPARSVWWKPSGSYWPSVQTIHLPTETRQRMPTGPFPVRRRCAVGFVQAHLASIVRRHLAHLATRNHRVAYGVDCDRPYSIYLEFRVAHRVILDHFDPIKLQLPLVWEWLTEKNRMNSLNSLKSILKSLGLRRVALKAVHVYARIFPNQLVRRNGINYALDLNQLVDFGTFIGGWEPATIEFLKKSLVQGDTVIEVGANVGAHTLLIGKLIGNKGHIYAFEPTDFASEKLRKNISINPDVSNITVRTEIVTNKKNDLPKLDIRSSWTVDSKKTPECTALKDTKSISIDDFAAEVFLESLALVKIDVDGYDFKVLQGAKSTLFRFLPVIFCELCEYTLNEQGDSIKDIYNLLTSMGYVAFLEDGIEISDVTSVLRLVSDKTSVNGIFIHKAKIHCYEWLK